MERDGRDRRDARGACWAGAVGTTFGTMASLFFAIYFDAIRMAKDHFRATMSAVLVALGVVRGLGYWAGSTNSTATCSRPSGWPSR